MNYAVEFPVPEKTIDSWDNLIVSNTNFSENTWDLTPLMHNKRAGVYASSMINFHLIEEFPLIVAPIKRYCYIRLGQAKPVTVAKEIAAIATKIVSYLKEKSFTSLEPINSYHFIEFNDWLKRHYYKNDKSNLGLASIANTLFQIIAVGQTMGFSDLPEDPLRLEISIWDWWGVNKTNKDRRQNGNEDKSIPLPIWINIIKKAWAEPNITQYIEGGLSKGLLKINNAKFGILIQAHTGLRISEILYLKTGCVEKDNRGKCWLNAEIEKTEKEPVPHKILIPESIYNLILELDRLTIPLRNEAEENKYLFYILSRSRRKQNVGDASERFKPVALESGKWNAYVLRPFLQKHCIDEYFQNSNKKTIRLASHCFRHTFAKIAVVDKNVNPAVIQTQYKHLSIEMTMQYVNLTKDHLKKSYIEGMIEAETIYTQGAEGESFKNCINNAKNVSDLDEVLDNLSKLYGINPLPFGLCLYDFKRGHCPNLGAQSCYMARCNDFVTNESFLPNFENEMNILQKHIEHCQTHGNVVEEKKAKYQFQKLDDIVKNITKGA